tara:strand:+ start:49 stop:294 length:246 start_codon:yes stop_codon:yes gene_type:complete
MILLPQSIKNALIEKRQTIKNRILNVLDSKPIVKKNESINLVRMFVLVPSENNFSKTGIISVIPRPSIIFSKRKIKIRPKD